MIDNELINLIVSYLENYKAMANMEKTQCEL